MVGWTKRDPDLENWTSYLTAGLLTPRAFKCLFLLLRFVKSFLSWGGWICCWVVLLGCSSGRGARECMCAHVNTHMYTLVGADQPRPQVGAAILDLVNHPRTPEPWDHPAFHLTQLVNLFDNKDIIGNIGGLCSRLFYLVLKNLKGIFANIFYVWAPGFWHLLVTWITGTLAPYF